MEKEFVSYDIALKLKELGFNEGCLAYYRFDNKFDNPKEPSLAFITIKLKEEKNPELTSNNNFSGFENVAAPLWQQCLDWFRKNYYMHVEISRHENGWGSYISIETFKDRFVKGYYAKIPYFIINNIEVGCSYRSYEVAREQAIFKALELCEKNS